MTRTIDFIFDFASPNGYFALKALSARGACRYQAAYSASIEIDGDDKPALVADWLVVTDTAHPRPSIDQLQAAE